MSTLHIDTFLIGINFKMSLSGLGRWLVGKELAL